MAEPKEVTEGNGKAQKKLETRREIKREEKGRRKRHET